MDINIFSYSSSQRPLEEEFELVSTSPCHFFNDSFQKSTLKHPITPKKVQIGRLVRGWKLKMERVHGDASHHESVVMQKMTTKEEDLVDICEGVPKREEDLDGEQQAESQHLLDENRQRSCRDEMSQLQR